MTRAKEPDGDLKLVRCVTVQEYLKSKKSSNSSIFSVIELKFNRLQYEQKKYQRRAYHRVIEIIISFSAIYEDILDFCVKEVCYLKSESN